MLIHLFRKEAYCIAIDFFGGVSRCDVLDICRLVLVNDFIHFSIGNMVDVSFRYFGIIIVLANVFVRNDFHDSG